MKDVQEALDQLVPEPARMSDWDAVLGEARPRSRSPVLKVAVATGVACLAALFVVAPWKGSERVGILDRALAAAGDGPVLHVVFRGGWGGTLVDLKTDERKPLYGEREVWFDPSRDLIHRIDRFGGVVVGEDLYDRNKGDNELTSLWRDYRPALENGTARVVGKDVVDGSPVYWIIVWSRMLPDVADHKDHEFAQQVAISRDTYKPVAMKYTRDREASPDGIEHVLRFETISVDEADFTGAPGKSLNGVAVMSGSDPIDISEAPKILGHTPFWLGPEFAGLPLSQAQEAFSATGRHEETLVTGARAAEIRTCLRLRSRGRSRCRHLPGAELRGDNVYVRGPVHWGPRHTGLTLFYGTVGDDPTTFKKEDSALLYDQPNVVVNEKIDREQVLLGFPQLAYLPPEGSILLMPGSSGYLGRNGVYISIRAASEKLVVEAARALRLMSNDGSGAGE
jgi:hypothetical protein